MDNKNLKINFNDVNAWKLPAAMYFDRGLKKDSIIVCSNFASEMPCCISGIECKSFNGIDAVAGYIKHHLINDNIVYNILKMEYSTTADECDDEIYLMDIQDIWTRNIGTVELLEYVEESHSDRWDEKLAEMKSYVKTLCKTLDKIFESNDENEKKSLLLDTAILFNDFFNDVCRWSFDLSVYFGSAEFVEKYEEHYNIQFWLCEEKEIWDEIKSGRSDDEHMAIVETLIHAMNA